MMMMMMMMIMMDTIHHDDSYDSDEDGDDLHTYNYPLLVSSNNYLSIYLYNIYMLSHPSIDLSIEKRLVALKLTTVTDEEYQNILDSPLVEATVAGGDVDDDDV